MANASLCEQDQIDLGSYTALARRLALSVAAATALTAQIAGASSWSQEERSPTAVEDDTAIVAIAARPLVVGSSVADDVLPAQVAQYALDDVGVVQFIIPAVVPRAALSPLSDEDVPLLYSVSDEAESAVPVSIVVRLPFPKIVYTDDNLPLLYAVTDGDDGVPAIVPAAKRFLPPAVVEDDFAHAAISDDEDLQLLSPTRARQYVPPALADDDFPIAAVVPPALDEDSQTGLIVRSTPALPGAPTDDDPPLLSTVTEEDWQQPLLVRIAQPPFRPTLPLDDDLPAQVLAGVFPDDEPPVVLPIRPTPILAVAIDDESVPYFVSDEHETTTQRIIVASRFQQPALADDELPTAPPALTDGELIPWIPLLSLPRVSSTIADEEIPFFARVVYEDDGPLPFIPLQLNRFIAAVVEREAFRWSARITLLSTASVITATQTLTRIAVVERITGITAPVRLTAIAPALTLHAIAVPVTLKQLTIVPSLTRGPSS